MVTSVEQCSGLACPQTCFVVGIAIMMMLFHLTLQYELVTPFLNVFDIVVPDAVRHTTLVCAWCFAPFGFVSHDVGWYSSLPVTFYITCLLACSLSKTGFHKGNTHKSITCVGMQSQFPNRKNENMRTLCKHLFL